MNHDDRIVCIETDPRPAALKPWSGDGVARWEGETLVAEALDIHPIQERAGRLPGLGAGKVTERCYKEAAEAFELPPLHQVMSAGRAYSAALAGTPVLGVSSPEA